MIPSWEYPPQKRPDPGRYGPPRLIVACRCEVARLESVAPRQNLNRNSVMRKTETSGWMVPGSPGALRRALRLAVIALGIGVVMTAGVARAQDDEEDEKTFEEK